MNIFFYAEEKREGRSKLETILKTIAGTDQLYSLSDLQQMRAKIQSKRHSRDIVILMTDSEAELDYFLECTELFEDVRLILILSTNDANQMAKAHRLHPRFVDIAPDHDFTKIGQVINKMLSNYHPGSTV